jgi:DNA topoisomerase-6 subunit B
VNLALFSNPHFIDMNDEGKATWEIKGLPPSKSVVISLELKGEMADVFDADDVYISGINPAFVMGAEALPGDWGIKGLEITESADVPVEEDEKAEEAEDLGEE